MPQAQRPMDSASSLLAGSVRLPLELPSLLQDFCWDWGK